MTAIKRMLHVRTCLLFFIAFTLAKDGDCQTERPIMPTSPQSQEFIKYGDYPVSHFTGVPDISIPLHQVNFYGYTIPLTLKYHASGIKAGSHVDPAGIGWTLFCGGEVSRTVRCVPDESADFKKGITALPYMGTYYRYVKDLTEGYVDGSQSGDVSYDDFNVTLPNGTFFKFYIQNDNNGGYKIHTNPSPLPVKISYEILSPGVWAYINSFTITDERGVKYYFADKELGTGKFGSTFTTAWKLTRITLPNTDKTIDFTYMSNNEVIVPKKGYARLIRDSVGQISCMKCPGMGNPDSRCIEFPDKGIRTSWVVNDYAQDNINSYWGALIPASILFGDKSIVFNYEEIRPVAGNVFIKLNNIALNDVNKKVSFTKSYADGFGSITLLEQLDIQDQQQQSQPLTYKFSYTTRGIDAPIGGGGPAYDHWGYIFPLGYNIRDRNEVSTNCTGFGPMATYNLPGFEVDVAWPVNSTDACLFETWVGPGNTTRYRTKLGSANRDPNFFPALTLNRIDYPTGGYTIFEYENNKYMDSEGMTPGQIRSAGGYRIKSISSYTNGIVSERKTYKYGVGECGYGFAPVQPSAKAYQKTYIGWHSTPEVLGFGPTCRFRERSFSSDNFENLLGSLPPVMYDEVTEYIGDANNNAGKTIFKYNIMKRLPPEEGGYGADHLQINPVTGDMYVLQDQLWKYGQLEVKEVYKNEHNAYTLIQKQENQWEYPLGAWLDDRSGLYMYDMAIVSNNPTDPFDNPHFYGCYEPNVFVSNPHYILTGKATLKGTKTTDYTGQPGSITNGETYTYDAYGQLALKTTTNSKGISYKTEYKYPYSSDILNESLSADNITALNALVTKNIVAPTIQETQYFGQNAVTTKRTDYQLFNNKPFPQSIKLKTDAFAIEENATYTLYDNDGNPLQYTSKDGIVTSLLWGYKGQYLVAKVAGADYNTASGKITQPVLDNPSSDQALRTELNNLRTISSAMVTTYTYKPSIGITSITDQNGKTAYYEYDGLGKLIVVKDQDGNIIKTFQYQYKQ